MLVSIIIINYNSFALTSDCVRSVIKQTNDVEYEIILVDNASTECEADNFLNEFPQIILVKSHTNGGFACGNNLGIEKARGEYVLLLNSDTILGEDSISKSVKYLEQKQEVAVMGCRMIFPNGDVQYSARRFKTISWELLDIFRFIPLLTAYKKRSKRMLGKYFRHDTDIECDWVSGAFFLISRKIIDQLPGKKLNDRFFMYGEDQLWCEQIKMLGYKILFYAGTTIIHISSGSTDISKQLALRKIMMKHELEIVRLRKGGGFYYFLFKIIYISKESTRNFIKAILFRLSGRMIRR